MSEKVPHLTERMLWFFYVTIVQVYANKTQGALLFSSFLYMEETSSWVKGLLNKEENENKACQGQYSISRLLLCTC